MKRSRSAPPVRGCGTHSLRSAETKCERFPAVDLPQVRSLQRLEVAHHGRNKLRHGRMDVHRALHRRVGRLGIHNVENAVDDLVTRKSQERGTENLLAVAIY